MAEIPGENLVPQGRAGSGAAFILGRTGPDALSLLANGERARAAAAYRAAALRQKEAEAIGKRYDEDKKINFDAGGAFQQSFNEYAAPLPNQIADKYQQLAAGKIDRPTLDRDVANLKGEAERERLLSIDRDKNMSGFLDKEIATNYRDRANLHTAFAQTLLVDDPANPGKPTRIRAGQYDELKAQQQIDNNPLTYVPDRIISDAIKRRATSTVADAYSNGVGGQHGASSYTSNGFMVKAGPDGALEPVKASNGLPVMDYSDVDLQRDRAGDHKFDMALKRLQLDYKTQQAANPGMRDKTDLELYKEAARPYVFFKETQSIGQNAQPHVPRAVAPTAEPVAPIDFSGEQTPYPQPVMLPDNYVHKGTNDPTIAQWPGTSYRVKVPQRAESYYTHGTSVAPPMDVTKAGVKKLKHFDNVALGEFDTADGRHVANNTQGQAGSFGKSDGAVVDATTGKHLYPQSEQEKRDLLGSGKGKLRVQFEFDSDNNKNYVADKQEAMKAIAAEKDANYQPKYHNNTALIEAEAEKRLKGGTMRTTHLYTPQNANYIRGFVGNHYDQHQAQLDRETQRIRAEYQAQKAQSGPSQKLRIGVPAPAATTPTQTTNGPKMTGGKKKI